MSLRWKPSVSPPCFIPLSASRRVAGCVLSASASFSCRIVRNVSFFDEVMLLEAVLNLCAINFEHLFKKRTFAV